MPERDLPERASMQSELGRPLALSSRLAASWRRSEDYGVSVETVDPVFTGTLDDESLFFSCGREVLTDLHRTLASSPISLMLTDADGLVLNRFCGDHAFLRALDKVHLAPGFSYSEREAGTNGLGLALADRTPTVVRAEEHYSLSLCTYTCAAAPVFDPLTGQLEGSVNITTYAQSSGELLLALAQSAAGNTSALMMARSVGQRPRPSPRGEVFRVEAPRLEPGSGGLAALSSSWEEALLLARSALASGRVVAAVGEAGSGRATLLALAERLARPRERILAATVPAPVDMEPWLALWTPELGKPHTAVIVRSVDALPLWVAERLSSLVSSAVASVPFSMTAERFSDIPAPLAALVDTVVQVPPLRDRPDDILPLAAHAALRARGRPVDVTVAAQQALRDYAWPGNVAELTQVIQEASMRTNLIDLRHLPPSVLVSGGHRLSRIESFERDEIVRVLTRPGMTMREAPDELGMSRATIYRKMRQYGIHLPTA